MRFLIRIVNASKNYLSGLINFLWNYYPDSKLKQSYEQKTSKKFRRPNKT
jgi:hypothetical protein